MSEMTPREIVSELDQHIIGQKRRKEQLRSHYVTVGEECSCKNHFAMKSPLKIF